MHDARAWPVVCYMLYELCELLLWLAGVNWEVVLDFVIMPDEWCH